MEKMAPSPKLILTDDVLLQILSRLPLHHLLRLKKVSLTFSKLTSEAYWLRSSTPSSALIVQDYCYENNVVRVDTEAAAAVIADTVLLPPSQRPTNLLVATCNGLLLYHDPVKEVYSVSNPVTRQWFRLPPNIHKGRNLAACIDFDPRLSPPHFKVAQFVSRPRASLYLEVFDSRSKASSQVVQMSRSAEAEKLLRRPNSCVLVDDVVYFFGSLTRISRADVRSKSRLTPLNLPVRWTDETGDTARLTLHVRGGRVHFAYHQQSEFEQIRVWALEEGPEAAAGGGATRWTPLFKCSYRSLDEQVRARLPGHCLSSVDVDVILGPDVLFLSARTGRRGAAAGYATVLVAYCVRTKTVSWMSPLKVIAERIFAF